MGAISGGLLFIGYLPYIWAIINHQTTPSPVSWGIWVVLDVMSLLAMRKEKANIGQLTAATVGAFCITALAMIFGKSTILGPVEWFSIVGAVTGIILWKKTGNALLAIIASQVAMFAGAIPTFARAYANPMQENPVAWSIWFVSCLCALFAVRKWDMANALQPLTFMTIETVMVFLVVIRPHLF